MSYVLGFLSIITMFLIGLVCWAFNKLGSHMKDVENSEDFIDGVTKAQEIKNEVMLDKEKRQTIRDRYDLGAPN